MQFLFGHDIQGDAVVDLEAIDTFWDLRLARDPARVFARSLIEGISAHLAEIDESIRNHLQNFAFQRLAVVDRNILRLATYEMLHGDHIPPEAAMNEAIEIAKRFGTAESPAFINGVLDSLLKEAQDSSS